MQISQTTKRQLKKNSKVLPLSGFTLVELLVVITVVGIMATLLSTALNQTRGKAQQVSCLNNLRQLQIGWVLYTDDNADELPLNRTIPTLVEKLWGRRTAPGSWVVGNPKEDQNTANIKAGTLFPYVKSVDLYRCPSDKSRVLAKQNMLRTRSYSMSAYLNGDNFGIDSRVKVKVSELVNPSPDRVFVFIEEDDASSWEGAFNVTPRDRFSLASSSSWASTPADSHNQGCNLSFADGHIEYWKWQWPKRSNLSSKLSGNKYELRDLKRLQECVPNP